MSLPQTGTDYAIWVGVQFPVLGAAALIVRWVLSWTGAKQLEAINQLKESHEKTIKAKDETIAILKESISKNEIDFKDQLSRQVEDHKVQISKLEKDITRLHKSNGS